MPGVPFGNGVTPPTPQGAPPMLPPGMQMPGGIDPRDLAEMQSKANAHDRLVELLTMVKDLAMAVGEREQTIQGMKIRIEHLEHEVKARTPVDDDESAPTPAEDDELAPSSN